MKSLALFWPLFLAFEPILTPVPRMDILVTGGAGFIGSHTVSHPMLGTIEDESVIKLELKDSANAIKKELGF